MSALARVRRQSMMSRCAGPSLPGAPVSGTSFKKAKLHMVLGVGGHKGAFALAAHHQVVGGQLVNGFAHGALADTVARGQVHLVRE